LAGTGDVVLVVLAHTGQINSAMTQDLFLTTSGDRQAGHPKGPWWSDATTRAGYATTTMQFGHLSRMYESADARRILTAVSQVSRTSSHLLFGHYERPDLSYHNLSVEDATELALDRPLWRLLAAGGAMH